MHQPRQVHLLRLSAQLASLSIALGHLALCDVPRNPVVRRVAGVKNRRMHEVKLSDGIITLSPLRLGDVEAHLAGEDDLLVRWLNGGPGTREGVEAYFRHCRDSALSASGRAPARHSQGLSTCGSQEKVWLPAR